jgi:hypothetical protein
MEKSTTTREAEVAFVRPVRSKCASCLSLKSAGRLEYEDEDDEEEKEEEERGGGEGFENPSASRSFCCRSTRLRRFFWDIS